MWLDRRALDGCRRRRSVVTVAGSPPPSQPLRTAYNAPLEPARGRGRGDRRVLGGNGGGMEEERGPGYFGHIGFLGGFQEVEEEMDPFVHAGADAGARAEDAAVDAGAGVEEEEEEEEEMGLQRLFLDAGAEEAVDAGAGAEDEEEVVDAEAEKMDAVDAEAEKVDAGAEREDAGIGSKSPEQEGKDKAGISSAAAATEKGQDDSASRDEAAGVSRVRVTEKQQAARVCDGGKAEDEFTAGPSASSALDREFASSPAALPGQEGPCP